eukprot:2672012-Rhodomonas_salina.1
MGVKLARTARAIGSHRRISLVVTGFHTWKAVYSEMAAVHKTSTAPPPSPAHTRTQAVHCSVWSSRRKSLSTTSAIRPK